ncbi:MAG: hypothetical protein RLZZ210_637 [Pseudomonadota bacterium]
MSNNRPLFAKMIENFQKVYGDGSLANLGNVIGGKVDLNIRMGMKTPSIGFTNGCAIRMSYA